MRYDDVRDGTKIVDEVIPKYVAAWEEKGMTHENGLTVHCYQPKQDRKYLVLISVSLRGKAFTVYHCYEVTNLY
jgi:hypothetical protein